MAKLRVVHFAQVPCKPFIIPVEDEKEAYKLITIIAQQHLFLESNKIIPDYSNILTVEMFNEESQEWEDYCNEETYEEWGEFEESLEEEFRDFSKELVALNM